MTEVGSVLAIGGIGVAIGLCPEPTRRVGEAVAAFIARFVQAGDELCGRAAAALWNYIKTPGPLSTVEVVFGSLLFAISLAVAAANFMILRPTVDILLPFENGATAFTVVLVALTGAVGILLHLDPRGRFVQLCGLMLIGAMGWLAWTRASMLQGAEEIVPGVAVAPSTALALGVTALVVILQLIEMATVAGALGHAGPALAFVALSPALVAVGVPAIVFRALAKMQLDDLMAQVCEVLVSVCVAVGTLIRQAPTVFSAWHHAQRMKRLQRRVELLGARDQLEVGRHAATVRADHALAQLQIDLAQEGRLRERVRERERRMMDTVADRLHGAVEELSEIIDAAVRTARKNAATLVAFETEPNEAIRRALWALCRPFTYLSPQPPPNRTDNRLN